MEQKKSEILIQQPDWLVYVCKDADKVYCINTNQRKLH